MPAAPCHLHFKKAPLGGFVFLLFSVCFFSQSWATYTRLLFLFLRVLYPVVSRIVRWQQLHGPGAPPGARGCTMGRPDPDFSGSLSPVPFHLRHTWVPIRILPRSWGSCLPGKALAMGTGPSFSLQMAGVEGSAAVGFLPWLPRPAHGDCHISPGSCSAVLLFGLKVDFRDRVCSCLILTWGQQKCGKIQVTYMSLP